LLKSYALHIDPIRKTHNNTGQIFYTPGIYHVRTMYICFPFRWPA